MKTDKRTNNDPLNKTKQKTKKLMNEQNEPH